MGKLALIGDELEDEESEMSSISDLVRDSELTRGTPDEEESSIELSVLRMLF